MADLSGESGNHIPFEQHPIYSEAMQALADGDEAAAVASLHKLVDLYPEEQALQDQLMRLELRATLAMPERMPAVHRRPPAALRMMLVMLVMLAVCLVGTVIFAAAYQFIVETAKQRQQQETALDSLRDDFQALVEAGDCTKAREVLGQLLSLGPDPTAEAAIGFCEQEMVRAGLYVDAVDAEQTGNGDRALGLYREILAQNPEYRDVAQRIKDLEEQAATEAAWHQAQDRVQAGDWAGAVDALSQIRTQNSEYRRREVEDQLYQAYVMLGQQLLSQARGSPDIVRDAIGYLGEALSMRPRQDDLVDELWLATGFASGAEAAAREDWENAVVRWEPIYEARPDYQNGVLEQNLYQAYPRAAEQLIARAGGQVELLRRAIGYLERAILREPENPVWVEERRLAVEYLAGDETFALGNWEAAIVRWGGIYTSHPDYQNGVLEENLREACANSPEPDPDYCPW